MKFQPGHSGNPAGRPPGSRNKKTIALEEAFAEHGEEILKDVVARAKEGQDTPLRLCMERMLARKRERAIAIALPAIETPEDARAAVAVVTAELAEGNLTIGEASGLIALIDRMVRLAERIAKMEQVRHEAEALVRMREARAAQEGREEEQAQALAQRMRDAIAARAARERAQQAANPPPTPTPPQAALYPPVNSGAAPAGEHGPGPVAEAA
jgi:Family of unknown function (DUF5681)